MNPFDYFTEIKKPALRCWNMYNFYLNLKEVGDEETCKDYLLGMEEADVRGVAAIGIAVAKGGYSTVRKTICA